MTVIYAVLNLFDPNGQDLLKPDQAYGGETRLFVLKAVDSAKGLLKLANALDASGSKLVSIQYVASVFEFQPEHFVGDVDLSAMSEDAISSGEICVSPVYSYSPQGNQELNIGVFAGLIDVYDHDYALEAGHPYVGQIGWAVSAGETCVEALKALLTYLDQNHINLKSIEYFKDVREFNFEANEPEGAIKDAIGQVKKENGIILVDFFSYELDGE